MEWRDYLRTYNLKQRDVAKMLNISVTHFRNIIDKKSYPSRKLAIEIERLTNGVMKKENAIFREEL